MTVPPCHCRTIGCSNCGKKDNRKKKKNSAPVGHRLPRTAVLPHVQLSQRHKRPQPITTGVSNTVTAIEVQRRQLRSNERQCTRCCDVDQRDSTGTMQQVRCLNHHQMSIRGHDRIQSFAFNVAVGDVDIYQLVAGRTDGSSTLVTHVGVRDVDMGQSWTMVVSDHGHGTVVQCRPTFGQVQFLQLRSGWRELQG